MQPSSSHGIDRIDSGLELTVSAAEDPSPTVSDVSSEQLLEQLAQFRAAAQHISSQGSSPSQNTTPRLPTEARWLMDRRKLLVKLKQDLDRHHRKTRIHKMEATKFCWSRVNERRACQSVDTTPLVSTEWLTQV